MKSKEKRVETKYQTKVATPEVLKSNKAPSPKEDSVKPDKEKEERMNSEIKEVRGSYVFYFRGARLRFNTKQQAEVQWRICNP